MRDIANSTIAKLDRKEIGALGLYADGVYNYKGVLKSRKQGWKTVKVNEYQTNFVCSRTTVEFIKIVSTSDTTEYAMRIKTEEGEYLSEYPVLWGCDFFK